MPGKLKVVSLLAPILFLCACGAGRQKAEDELKEAVLLFNEGVRWGRLQDVMPRVDSKNTEHFLKMHEKFGTDIQVSDYEILNSSYDPIQKTAKVTVQITWYRQSEMELHTTVLLQSWEYHIPEWMLATETYQSGEVF